MTRMISEEEFMDTKLSAEWVEGYGPKKGTWEHEAVRLDKGAARDKDRLLPKLKRWGRAGWEVVAIVPGGFFDTYDIIYVKREGRA